jgi:hypothetical protein
MKMIQKHVFRVVVLLVWGVLLLIPFDILAEEEEHAHQEEHHYHRHHVAVFVGGTNTEIHSEEHGHDEGGTDQTERTNALTIGIDYGYRLTSLVGVAGLLEYAGGDVHSTVAAGGLFLHAIGGLKFLLAPGVEYREDHTNFLFRTAVYYDIFFGNMTVAPVVNVDFVDGEQNLVYGISVGYGF